MRLFVAAELPDSMLDALAETSAALRSSVRGRYVGSDLFHVTLAFLGEVESSRCAELEDALSRSCAEHGPFETSLGALGSFGKKSRATLWQGFTETSAFDALAGDVRKVLREAGFAFDGKGFIPHVTLMRNADLSSGILPMPSIAAGAIDTVTLFSSDLSGPRPVYDAITRITLS
ncbi:MAG: RNA 2',3'-cyclic phosphodiesterase [Coriobacteriales bacterium]|jgi:2'-5' RNA ligase